jgi:hypothetical protein
MNMPVISAISTPTDLVAQHDPVRDKVLRLVRSSGTIARCSPQPACRCDGDPVTADLATVNGRRSA